MLHITDGDRIEDARSAPSAGGPVCEELERAVARPPCHPACAADQTPSASDLESGPADTFDLRIDIVTGEDRPHTLPIEGLGRLLLGDQESGVGIILMMILDVGDDPVPHHHRIGFEGCAPVVAEDIPVPDPPDEPLRTGTFPEPHHK